MTYALGRGGGGVEVRVEGFNKSADSIELR